MSFGSTVSIGMKVLVERVYMLDNIHSMYDVAVASGIDNSWYDSANSTCCELSLEYNLPVETVAGVIATLSPSLSWKKNLLECNRLLSWFVSNDATLPPNMMAYPANVNKALRILTGEPPASVLGGMKVNSFYLNIVNPSGNYAVTIDRHAIAIAQYGLRALGKSSGSLVPTRAAYLHIAQAYRQVSYSVNVLPSQVQSATWSLLTNSQEGF